MQLDKNHLKQIVINVFDRNIIKTKQHVFACSAFVWSLVSEIWYAHFWYGFIRFCTHCPYQIHVIIYLAYTTKLLNNYLYLHAYKLLHHVFCLFLKSIHFLYVKPKINQIMHGSATFLSNWILCQLHIMHPALYCLTMKYNGVTPFMRKYFYFLATSNLCFQDIVHEKSSPASGLVPEFEMWRYFGTKQKSK